MKSDWLLNLKTRLANAEAFAARHPRALTLTVVGLLSGFAVTAFGIAPLAPNAADLPQRTIAETVQPAGDMDMQLAELAAYQVTLWRSDLTRSSDTADSLLKRTGAFDPTVAQFLRTDPVARRVLQGRAGKMIQVSADASGRVEKLIARFPAEKPDQQATHFSRLTVSRDASSAGLSARLETVPLQAQTRLGSGTIRTSLFAATDEARIPDAIASQMADMFSGDIDFHRELRKGDRFSVVYEAMTADGELLSWYGPRASLGLDYLRDLASST